MVSFSCEACGDVLTKKSLDKHRNQCRGASFTCLDCMVHFHGTEYKSHTSCMSEAQKVQGHLYREKEKKGDKRKSLNGDMGAMVPRRAYVEDVSEGEDSQAVAIVDVPPRAPTPPSAAAELPPNVNVFDFLVTEQTPNGNKSLPGAWDDAPMIDQQAHNGATESQLTQYSEFSQDGSNYRNVGFTYGNAPIEPSFARYDSWQNLTDSQNSHALMPPPYVTPAPKEHRREKKEKHATEKSDKKRKRHQVEELDLSSTNRPSSRDEMMIDPVSESRNGRVLHSGLTGGLNRLVTETEFLEDRIDAGPTPILSPIKRTRRENDDDNKKSRRISSYASHGTTTSKASSSKHSSDKHERSRESERRYHDDKPSRRHSPERKYHDDKHRRRSHRHDSFSSDDYSGRPKHQKAIEYPSDRPMSVQPNDKNQLVTYMTRADLFMSLITKGPDSERGCSVNKVLKRYHRERHVRGEEKEDEDKELWKSLRLRRNERGEIVLIC